MFGLLDISASGLTAQRMRLDTISANITHADSIRDSRGNLNPYRRKDVYFAPGNPRATSATGRTFGVHVAAVREDPRAVLVGRHDPDSPNAYKDGPFKGYLAQTGINPVVEMVNLIEATRAYDANVSAAEATKQMVGSTLRLLA